MCCPECGGFCAFSFMDEVNERPVYQCGYMGVETERTIGPHTHLIRTLDHSDRFYVIDALRPLLVKPIRVGKQASEAILKARGWVFAKEHGHKVVPTVWTAVTA